MHISWHGQYTVKIVSKQATIVVDPYAPTIGLPPFRAKADIVALSNPASPDMSHVDGIQQSEVLVDSPGEYSVRESTLHAIPWQADDGTERSLFRWVIEGMVIVHLGALNRDLADEERGALEQTDIDILFVPAGGGSSIGVKEAAALTTSLEPRMVIPIHTALPKLKEKLASVTEFTKELGAESVKAEKKIIVKANRLPQDDMEIVVLKP